VVQPTLAKSRWSQLHRDEPDAEITSTFDAGIAKDATASIVANVTSLHAISGVDLHC